MCEVSELIGKTLIKINVIEENEIIFECNDGIEYKMYHSQDSSEYVRVVDICGEIENLVGSPILIAEERTNIDKEFVHGYAIWTFYELATNKGNVTIMWRGESESYYSVSVDFEKCNKEILP